MRVMHEKQTQRTALHGRARRCADELAEPKKAGLNKV